MSPDRPEQPADASAEDATDGDDDVSYERFVFWYLGEYRFAVPVGDVKAITEKPRDVTAVPRSPEAVVGVTDLRGEITAIIDPRVYVPDAGDPVTGAALLVLDRPTDEQAAAVVVDDVHGVETVSEADVFAPEDFEDEEVEGSALEHPLLVGLVRRTWRDEDAVREEIVAQVERRAADGTAEEFATAFDDGGLRTGTARETEVSEDDDGVEVGEFTLEEADAIDTEPIDDLGVQGLDDIGTESFAGAGDTARVAGGDGASGGAGPDDPTGVSSARSTAGESGADDIEVDVTPVVSIDRLLRAIEGERDRRQTAR